MIRRKKLTIFTDAKDDTTVLELKKMIEGKGRVSRIQLRIHQGLSVICHSALELDFIQ